MPFLVVFDSIMKNFSLVLGIHRTNAAGMSTFRLEIFFDGERWIWIKAQLNR